MDVPISSLTMPCVGLVALTGMCSLGVPGVAGADEDSSVQSAGDEEHFQVVERFPDRDDSTDQPEVQLAGVDDDSPLADAVARVEHEQWDRADEHLRSDDAADQLAEHEEIRFLAGYVAMETGDAERALQHFEGLCEDLDTIGDYCTYYEAQAAMQQDDVHRATVATARVPHDSRLHADAVFLHAEALIEAGENSDLEQATEVLRAYLDEYDGRNDAAAARLMLGETLESLQRHEAAAEAYLDLRDEHPLRSEANDANERLEQLLEDELDEDDWAARIHDDSLERRMRRWRGLHRLHRSERVIDELSDEIDDFPAGAQNQRCEALYMVADSHTKLRRHADAIGWYDRVLEECADVEDYEIRALYRTGRSRWNAGRRQEAIDHFERIWTEYEDHSFADDALYFTARILRSEDEHDEALEMLHRQVDRYPDGDMAADGHWLIVRHHFEQDQYQQAVDYIDGLDDTGEDDLYTRGRLRYFRGRAMEMIGDGAAAAESFGRVAERHPKSYYALLAFNRLARLYGARSENEEVCEAATRYCDRFLSDANAPAAGVEIPEQLQDDDAFDRGSVLLALGLTSQSRGEFSDLRRRHAGDDSTLWGLASLLHDAEAYPISHNIARRHIDGWMNEYPRPRTLTRWQIGYPRPFSRHVEHYAGRRDGVDAAKIHAIMREESGFSPTIESWANARGLLQLLDDTARRMADRVGMDSYSTTDLNDPETNIRLGSAYMEHLGEQLEPHPVLITAGYNGGSGNVANWVDDFGDLPIDLFVEDIPFGQTRNYTKRVLMSYWIYTYLHGDERVPWLNFAFDSGRD